MIRFVYFDLDDTLLDHRAAEGAALGACRERWAERLGAHALAHVRATYDRHNAPLWRDYGAGRVTRAELQHLRFRRTLDALGAPELDADEVGAHYLARYAAHWAWLAGAEAAFLAVARRYPVGLLTNGFVELQRAKLAAFPALAARASAVVISEDVGAAKPHPRLFAHAAEAAGVAPAEILLVGDSLHADVEGALAAGWQAAWYRPSEAGAEPGAELGPPGAFAFSDWRALLDRLDVPRAGAPG